MEKQQDNNPLKVRSYRGITTAALQLYSHSLIGILKSQWPWLLLTAAFSTAVGMMTIYMRYFFVPAAILALVANGWLWLMTTRWLTRNTLLNTIRKTGRHWLLAVWVVIAVFIVLIPFSALASLPLTVLALAQWEATNSTLLGDPDGMPQHMPYMFGTVWFLTSILQQLLHLTTVFVGYYAWGSVEARKRERQALNA